jgi:hypothetical protein
MRTAAQWTMYLGMAVAMASGAMWPRPTWAGVALGLLIIALGVALRRKAGAPTAEAQHGAGAGAKAPRTGTLDDALAQFSAETKALAEQAEGLDLEAIKRRCEDLVWIGPERVGQAQELIAARVGFAQYAEVMAPLATAERWLNRAWSAAADGHRPEAVASLRTAQEFAGEAAEVGKGKLGVSALPAPGG